ARSDPRLPAPHPANSRWSSSRCLCDPTSHSAIARPLTTFRSRPPRRGSAASSHPPHTFPRTAALSHASPSLPPDAASLAACSRQASPAVRPP
ncbi:MAG: hypothetical protein ACK55I_45740, partial [bacterium]